MVTIWFWLIRVMIAGAGVVWPDYVYRHLGQMVASGMICVALVVALTARFRARCYRARGQARGQAWVRGRSAQDSRSARRSW